MRGDRYYVQYIRGMNIDLKFVYITADVLEIFMCNIYVVVFLGWQAVKSVFPGASCETYAPE